MAMADSTKQLIEIHDKSKAAGIYSGFFDLTLTVQAEPVTGSRDPPGVVG
jgi:hypothetical protein